MIVTLALNRCACHIELLPAAMLKADKRAIRTHRYELNVDDRFDRTAKVSGHDNPPSAINLQNASPFKVLACRRHLKYDTADLGIERDRLGRRTACTRELCGWPPVRKARYEHVEHDRSGRTDFNFFYDRRGRVSCVVHVQPH